MTCTIPEHSLRDLRSRHRAAQVLPTSRTGHGGIQQCCHAYPTSSHHCETLLQVPGTPQLRRMYSDNILLSAHELRKHSTNSISTYHCAELALDQGLDNPFVSKHSTLDNTSTSSTPLAMYTETDSDASSSYETTRLDFPLPLNPTSALILREDILPKESNKHYIDTKFRKFLTTPPDRSYPHGHWGMYTGADMYLTDVEYNLELAGEELLNSVDPLTRFQNEIRPQIPKKDLNGHRLLHARSASSVLPTRTSHTKNRRSILVQKQNTTSVESLDSWRCLGSNPCEPASTSPRTQNPSTKNNAGPGSTTFTHSPNVIIPSLASAGRQRPTHRAHLSVPLTGLGLSSARGSPAKSEPLTPSFHHRATRSQPMIRTSDIKRAEMQGPTSFMDITPERKSRDLSLGTHKEKVRKLLTRASSSIISWGKNLTNVRRANKLPRNTLNSQ